MKIGELLLNGGKPGAEYINFTNCVNVLALTAVSAVFLFQEPTYGIEIVPAPQESETSHE